MRASFTSHAARSGSGCGSRRYEVASATSSGLSLNFEKIRENQEVSLRDVCDDFPVPTTVLVVDDHPSFRRLAKQLLQAGGFDVVGEAEYGEAGLAEARRLQPDVVLLDVLLPDMSGFAVADALAEGSAAPVVVFVSSRSASELAAGLERSPAQGFIPKRELTAEALAALVDGAG
jgi:CheY-like chemotaxis protein